MKEEKLNVLILEDNPDDAELIVRELEKAGFVFEWKRVETEKAFKKVLSEKPDIILADYKLPSFNGLAAIKLQQKIVPEIPLILVSGTIGEEHAAEYLKAGATDYVLKDKLSRLSPVVKHALKEAEEHRERKKAEEALRKSEERFKYLVKNSNDVFVIIDENGKEIFVSDSVERITGFTPAETMGHSGFEFLHPDDIDHMSKTLSKVLETPRETIREEYRHRRKGGGWVHLEAIGTNYLHEPSVEGIVLNVRDITERKKAEEALRKSEEKYKLVTDNITDLVSMCDENGLFSYVSPSYQTILGYKPESIIGLSVHTLVHPDDLPYIKDLIQKKIDNLEDSSAIFRMQHKDGYYLWFESHGRLLLDSKGKLKGAVFNTRDITERKKAEEEIKAKSEFLESLIKQSPLPTFVMDSKGFVVIVNEAFLKFYAVPNKEMVLGKNALTEPANVRHGVIKYFREALKGKIVEIPEIEFVSPYKNKKVITRGRLFPILDPTGTLTNVVVIQEDITERKKAEEQLKKTNEELSAFNRLAVGRELRMIELKSEINELLKKMGQEGKYKVIE